MKRSLRFTTRTEVFFSFFWANCFLLWCCKISICQMKILSQLFVFSLALLESCKWILAANCVWWIILPSTLNPEVKRWSCLWVFSMHLAYSDSICAGKGNYHNPLRAMTPQILTLGGQQISQPAPDVIIKFHTLGSLNNSNLVLTVLEAGESKIKVSAEFLSSETSLLGLQMSISSLCPHMVLLSVLSIS